MDVATLGALCALGSAVAWALTSLLVPIAIGDTVFFESTRMPPWWPWPASWC